MTVKEFLKSNDSINISGLAKVMYPTNKSAAAYLLRKLSDNATRPFTKSDGEKALAALNELINDINQLSNE